MDELKPPPGYHEGRTFVYVPIERHPKDFPLEPGIVGYELVGEMPIRVEGSDG